MTTKTLSMLLNGGLCILVFTACCSMAGPASDRPALTRESLLVAVAATEERKPRGTLRCH